MSTKYKYEQSTHLPSSKYYISLVIRNAAVADKPRDAFRRQLRSPNMVPLHTLGMVSY